MKTTTQIRPHKVLGQVEEGKDIHALSWTTGEFSDFIFSFKKIKFVEDKDNDKLIIKFEYEIHRIPEHVKEYSKEKLEKEFPRVAEIPFNSERNFMKRYFKKIS